jgi:hypothetical protein
MYRISTLENGLFEWNGSAWVSMNSNLVPTNPNLPRDTEGLAVNTFSTRPGDTNTVIFGTHSDNHMGASVIQNSGIWRGSKGSSGWSWSQVVDPFTANDVFKLRWSDANTVHAATYSGYWISRLQGIAGSWTQVVSNPITDLEVQPGNPNVVYLANSSVGLQKVTWTQSGGTWNPTTSVDVSLQPCVAHLAISAAQPNVVYYMAADATCSNYTSLYKATNDSAVRIPNCNGTALGSGCFPSTALESANVTWTGAISVSPTNPDDMIIGDVGMLVSNNATRGMTWQGVNGMHPDLHRFGWGDGQWAMAVGDGGYFYSPVTDLVNWKSDSNLSQETSVTDFDLQPGMGWLMGSAWDTSGFVTSNFLQVPSSFSTDGLGGDENFITADTGTAGRFWGVDQYGNCNVTTNGGGAWTSCNLPNKTPTGEILHDRVPNVFLYAISGNTLYQNKGQSWASLVSVPEQATGLFGVGHYLSSLGGSYLYLVGAKKLWMSAAGAPPVDVTPTNAKGPVSRVLTHPSTNAGDQVTAQTAWAVAHTWPPPSQYVQIWTTNTAGVNHQWTDITDNFPQSNEVWDIVSDPTSGSPPSIFYAGTMTGVYKYDGSLPAGQRWARWILNLPASGSQEVRRLHIWDARPTGGNLMVYAGVMGSGIWLRDGAQSAP